MKNVVKNIVNKEQWRFIGLLRELRGTRLDSSAIQLFMCALFFVMNIYLPSSKKTLKQEYEQIDTMGFDVTDIS